MLESNPVQKLADVHSEYVYDKAGRNLMEMWQSRVFGGCVMNKVGMKNGGYFTNNLREKVMEYKLEYLYGGGYYKLENLPDPENNQIIDMYIILEDVKKFEDIQYLKDLFNLENNQIKDNK